MKELILDKYETVDAFIAITGIKLSRTYIYLLLKDQVNPTLEVLEELARALGKDVVELVKIIYGDRHRNDRPGD